MPAHKESELSKNPCGVFLNDYVPAKDEKQNIKPISRVNYVTSSKFTTKPRYGDIFLKLSLPSCFLHVGILFLFAALGISL